MIEKLKDALKEALEKGADYADIRYINNATQQVRTKNRNVELCFESHDTGTGIRVLAGGAWGFAATYEHDLESLKECAHKAVRIARASARTVHDPVRLSAAEPYVDSFKNGFEKDPFAVSIDEKIELLKEANGRMMEEPSIKAAFGEMFCSRIEKDFLNTEGAEIHQELVACGAGIHAHVLGDGEIQKRSYPAPFGGNVANRGYEFIESMELERNALPIAREAAELLKAPQCPAEKTTVVIGSGQMALQIHESCGHPTELDRILGSEASLAGTSFMSPDMLGKSRYGSEMVNIYADATIEGGLGSFKYDDEGIPGQRTSIIREGILADFLSSRETASVLGKTSNGTMRAEGWQRIPLIRMTNMNLEPGDWTLDEIIKDTANGILMEDNRSWSIDDKRLNFQFGTEVGREIKDGSLGRFIKNPTYTGITPEFWGSCDAIAGKADWQMWGIWGCGKGDPMQIMHVGHGSAPARFRNVRIGIGKWDAESPPK